MKSKIINNVPIFSSLPPEEIENLSAELQTRLFSARSILFKEGDSDTFCYIIQEGQVQIVKSLGTGDERVLGLRESGSILGEMSLFTSRHTHTASVQALTPVVLLELSQEKFGALLHRQPGMACEIIQILSNRLDESENLTIQDLHQKNIALTKAYQDLKAAQEQIIEKQVLEKELQIARNIQQSILPQVIPQSETIHCGALMVAARAVGGDFYDFIPLANGWLGIAVGDVSDKGVPAALSMALTYSLLHATAHHELSPGETLRTVNRHLVEINVSDMFVTLLYGILDSQTGIFRYARAGHPPPYLADKNGNSLMVTTRLGQALGLFDHLILDEQEIEIPPGGWLLLYSDGLSEATNQPGEFYSMEMMSDLFREDKDSDPQSFCQRLWQSVQDFSTGIPQSDDFTIAALKRVISETR